MISREKCAFIRIACFTLIAIPALLFLPYVSTPLFPSLNGDYTLFTVIGRGWLSGLIPYADLFDHKGPVVFFVQALAWSLGIGKWGIWIFEVAAAVICFELIYRCGRLLRISLGYNIVALSISILAYFSYIDSGNIVEEWSLPFQLIALIIAIKYFTGSYKNLRWAAFWVGTCFGIVAMTRINNNAVICGIVLGLLVRFIRLREWKNLWQSAVFFVVGCFAACAPFFVYFLAKGAFSDMIYATFIYNFKYKQAWYIAPIMETFERLIPCLVLPFTAYFFDRKNHTHFFLTFTLIALITFATFIYGADYSHYFLMTVPVTALAAMQLSSVGKWWRIVVVLVLLYAPYLNRRKPGRTYRWIQEHRAEAKMSPYNGLYTASALQVIPLEDFNSVYTLGDMELAEPLVELGYFPVGTYFFLQQYQVKVDSLIGDKMRKAFIAANPKWIITSENLRGSNVLGTLIDNYVEIPSASLPPYFIKKKYRVYKRIN